MVYNKNESAKKYRQKHPNYYKQYYKNHKNKWKNYNKNNTENAKKYRERHPERLKDRRLKLYYGITLEDYNKMLQEQNGVCSICKEMETRLICGKIVMLSVDHDHKTGKVRGLICNKCNRLLGFVNDNTKLLEEVINYLKKFS